MSAGLIQLFIGPGCPHCTGMIKITSDLVKTGKIARLEIINIEQDMDAPTKLGIRSVPAFKIGSFVLTGVHTGDELLDWMDKTDSESGLSNYLNQAFENGELDKVIAEISRQNEWLDHCLSMLVDLETPLTSRIAISAVFEHFQNSDQLKRLIPKMCKFTDSNHESVRVDVAYILGLTGDISALSCLESLANDSFDDVRESARDAVEMIRSL